MFFFCLFALLRRWNGMCVFIAATRTIGAIVGTSFFFLGFLLLIFVWKTNRRRKKNCDKKGGVMELLEPFFKPLFTTLIIYLLFVVSWLLMNNLILELLASRLVPKELQIWCVCLFVCLFLQWFVELLLWCVLHFLLYKMMDGRWWSKKMTTRLATALCFLAKRFAKLLLDKLQFFGSTKFEIIQKR